MGIYTQDVISFKKYVKIFLGARLNYINNQTDMYTYLTKLNTTTNNINFPFSPKIGIIFQPLKNISIFWSYSNSFTLNTGVDIYGNSLKPSIIDQYEIGIKNNLFNNKLQFNTTFYYILNNNLAQTSLENGNTNSNIKELAGEIVSKGLEVDIIYKPIKNLIFISGYSFTESKYTKSNIYIVGSELRYNPKNTANLSVNYDFINGFLKNFNIGIISQYFGTRYAGRSTRLTINNDSQQLIPLNEYFLIDGVVGYKYKNLNCNIKIANILNQFSYNIHDDNSLNPITPLNYSITVAYKFL